MSQSSTSLPGSTGNKRAPLSLPQPRGFGKTSRKDTWWLVPLLVFLGFGTFVVYATWAAFQGNYYRLTAGGADYLSPFYSPELFGEAYPGRAWFGGKPGFWPSWLPFSPALLILGGPVGFRFTCYYYRGAYYKAFWADPSSCAVGEPRNSFRGENSFPLIIQNIHRYFMYVAVLFLLVLTYDVWLALWFKDASGKEHFGIGAGTLLMALNVCLLWSYTLGCHSLRHLIGGGRDEISKSACAKAYSCVTCLNKRHMMWAWFSLTTVGFTDVYIRLCSMGIWHDWRIL